MTSTYDSTGITYDRYATIRARLVTLAQAEFGDSVNTSEDSFLGHMISNEALLIDENNEIGQDVYDHGSLNNSSGARLVGQTSLVGVERQAAAYSTITLTLTAVRACTVLVGSLYGTEAKVNFATDAEVVFTGAGNADVTATCTVVGANEVAIGECDQIVTSVNGITGVTNAAIAVPGRLRQTDAEVKAEHTLVTATSGLDDAGSIYNALIEVAGVSAAYIHDNDTPGTVDGVPAKTIHISVIGGTDALVAAAIDTNKTSSVPMHGSESVSVYNSTTGQTKTRKFDRATAVPIYISADITKIGGLAPDDAEAQIRTALVAHFASFRIADDVDYNGILEPFYSVAGVRVNEWYIGIAATPTGTTTLTMTALQLAQMTAAQSLTNVVISVT